MWNSTRVSKWTTPLIFVFLIFLIVCLSPLPISFLLKLAVPLPLPKMLFLRWAFPSCLMETKGRDRCQRARENVCLCSWSRLSVFYEPEPLPLEPAGWQKPVRVSLEYSHEQNATGYSIPTHQHCETLKWVTDWTVHFGRCTCCILDIILMRVWGYQTSETTSENNFLI